MISERVPVQNSTDTVSQMRQRRRRIPVPGLFLRLMIAMILSWLIIMIFFVSGAVSH